MMRFVFGRDDAGAKASILFLTSVRFGSRSSSVDAPLFWMSALPSFTDQLLTDLTLSGHQSSKLVGPCQEPLPGQV